MNQSRQTSQRPAFSFLTSRPKPGVGSPQQGANDFSDIQLPPIPSPRENANPISLDENKSVEEEVGDLLYDFFEYQKTIENIVDRSNIYERENGNGLSSRETMKLFYYISKLQGVSDELRVLEEDLYQVGTVKATNLGLEITNALKGLAPFWARFDYLS